MAPHDPSFHPTARRAHDVDCRCRRDPTLTDLTQPTGSSPTNNNSHKVSLKMELDGASFHPHSYSRAFGCAIERWHIFQSNPDPGSQKVSTNATFCGASGKLSSFSGTRNISNNTDQLGFFSGDHLSQASLLDRDSYWVKHALGLWFL